MVPLILCLLPCKQPWEQVREERCWESAHLGAQRSFKHFYTTVSCALLSASLTRMQAEEIITSRSSAWPLSSSDFFRFPDEKSLSPLWHFFLWNASSQLSASWSSEANTFCGNWGINSKVLWIHFVAILFWFRFWNRLTCLWWFSNVWCWRYILRLEWRVAKHNDKPRRSYRGF